MIKPIEVGQRVTTEWTFKADGSYRDGTITEIMNLSTVFRPPSYFVTFDDGRRECFTEEMIMDRFSNLYDQPQLPFNCTNCGNFCPSGTLPNGLCSNCNLIGKQIRVQWGRFGMQPCRVERVTKNGTVYASRWNARQQDWTSPKQIEFKGWWKLANR